MKGEVLASGAVGSQNTSILCWARHDAGDLSLPAAMATGPSEALLVEPGPLVDDGNLLLVLAHQLLQARREVDIVIFGARNGVGGVGGRTSLFPPAHGSTASSTSLPPTPHLGGLVRAVLHGDGA